MWTVIAPAVVAIAGWFIVSLLSKRAAREQHRREAALEHIERQLGELYGPLAFLLLEGTRVFEDLAEDFGEDWLHGRRSLNTEEIEKWLYWSEHYFIPRNQRIQALLSSQSHLIVGDHVPASFLAFVDHHASWTLELERWRKTGIREGLYSRRSWPVKFGDEVLATFRALKQQHASLVGAESPRLLDDLVEIAPLAKRTSRRPRRDPWREEPGMRKAT